MSDSCAYRLFAENKKSILEMDASRRSVSKMSRLARDKAKEKDFLWTSRLLFEQELPNLERVLRHKKIAEERDEAYWFYCYYCSLILIEFYKQLYEKQDKLDYYMDLAKKLKARWEVEEDLSKKNKKKAAELIDLILQDLHDLCEIPEHTSQMRKWISYINLYRLHLVFTRLTVRQSILWAQNQHLFDRFDQWLGTHTDVSQLISNLDSPVGVFNLLSVSIYAIRFLINAGTLIKHLLLNDGKLATELEKQRHCDLLNDAVWGTVNFLSNYAPYVGIAAPAANALTAGFLCFDVLLLVYRRHLVEAHFAKKEKQFLNELENEHLYPLARQQLKQLEIDRISSNAEYFFNIAAAIILLCSFSSIIFFAPASILPICFLITTFAVAMYVTASQFAGCVNKMLVYRAAEKEDKLAALGEVKQTTKDFALSFAKHMILPVIFFSVFAVSWQAGLVLLVVYLGYEYINSRVDKLDKERKQLESVDNCSTSRSTPALRGIGTELKDQQPLVEIELPAEEGEYSVAALFTMDNALSPQT